MSPGGQFVSSPNSGWFQPNTLEDASCHRPLDDGFAKRVEGFQLAALCGYRRVDRRATRIQIGGDALLLWQWRKRHPRFFEDRLRNQLHLNDKSKTTMRKVMEIATKRIAYFAEHQAEFEGFVHLRNANEHFGRRMNVFAAPPSEDYLAEMANRIQNLFNPFLLSGFVQHKPKILDADLPIFSALHHLRRDADYLLFRKENGDLFFFTHRSFLNWAEYTFHGDPIVLKDLTMRSIVNSEFAETHIVFETPYLLLEDALAHLAEPKNQTRYFVLTQDGSSQGEVLGVVDGRQLRVI